MADGIEVKRSTTVIAGADSEWSPRWDGLGRDNLEYGGDLYIAYPVDVARARERALESARKVMKHRYDVFTSQAALMDELFSALADLDAAEGGAG